MGKPENKRCQNIPQPFGLRWSRVQIPRAWSQPVPPARRNQGLEKCWVDSWKTQKIMYFLSRFLPYLTLPVVDGDICFSNFFFWFPSFLAWWSQFEWVWRPRTGVIWSSSATIIISSDGIKGVESLWITSHGVVHQEYRRHWYVLSIMVATVVDSSLPWWPMILLLFVGVVKDRDQYLYF